jgi:hypothetical protein
MRKLLTKYGITTDLKYLLADIYNRHGERYVFG